MSYFSDRQRGERPRTEEAISPVAWLGIKSLIDRRATDGSFGQDFPENCPDGNAIVGTDHTGFVSALFAEIPEITAQKWELSEVPDTLTILDLIEFCWRYMAKPERLSYHSFFNHHHLGFDVEAGREEFRIDVNRILARNGIAYELGSEGLVRRLASNVFNSDLHTARYETGDDELDSLLDEAIKKYLNPELQTRRDALEKIWDAWERLKTIEHGANKKEQATRLINRVSDQPKYLELLNEEAAALTQAGNQFQIRHSETSQEKLIKAEQIDYLFQRMFSFIDMILKATDRIR